MIPGDPNILALAGGAVGVVASACGTACLIRKSKGPRERRFVVRAMLVSWIALGFLGMVSILKPKASPWVWSVFFGLLPFTAALMNRRQIALRHSEQSKEFPNEADRRPDVNLKPKPHNGS